MDGQKLEWPPEMKERSVSAFKPDVASWYAGVYTFAKESLRKKFLLQYQLGQTAEVVFEEDVIVHVF